MHRNVGNAERYARLAIGAAAGVAATRAHGWPRAALGTIAAAGLGTGAAQYCPINQVAGRDSFRNSADVDARMERDSDIRRDTAVRGALGVSPTDDSPRVTRDSDLFGEGGSFR